MMQPIRCLVVGAGFSGAIVARELAENEGLPVIVIDSRDHIAGNCHTERDNSTGVMVHRYGPHIFHTDREDVWKYVNRFATFQPFVNRVKASISRGIFGLPINLHTINQFFGQRFAPAEARSFVESLGDKSISDPRNFEEQALKFLGRELYEAFFYGYTKKQWGCEPSELPASILKRLPVRFDYNDSYYNSRYQGIPLEGYTELIRNILDHPRIEVRLSTSWSEAMLDEFYHIFYTGSIDDFFQYSEGRLRYRTVWWKRLEADGDLQGNAVINYPELQVPHTRIHEHKHFAPWEKHARTVAFVEFSKATEERDTPYYPLRLATDMQTFDKYAAKARASQKLSFLGRLATYRYMDMHHVIGEALDFSRTWLSARTEKSLLPVFPFGIN